MKISFIKLCLIFFIAQNSFSAHANDTVDLQWSICNSSPEQILKQLGQTSAEKSKDGAITYFDTPLATFTKNGISFRTKNTDNDFISSVKVRFAQETSTQNSADCSWDRYGNQEFYTCEVQAPVINGTIPWSSEQKNFVEQYHPIEWDQLVKFGPYQNPKWKIKIAGLKATFDSVNTDRGYLMELSIKISQVDAETIYNEVTKILNSKGVPLCNIQEGKTSRLFRLMGIFPLY